MIKGPFGFSQGWNTKVGPYEMPDNTFVDGQNMDYAGSRLIKKKGNTLWTGATLNGANPITGLAYFAGVLVGESSGKIKTFSPTASGGSWTDITGAVTFAGGDNVWMQALNNILVIGQFASTTISWAGSGNCANAAGSPPQDVKCAAVANNYLFLGNLTNGSVPYRVQWSAVADPTTWPAGNFVDVGKYDSTNDGIQALFPFGEDLLIFKNNSISRLYTNQISGSLGPLTTVADRFGCAGPDCVDALPDGSVAFVGYNNHVYIYNGNTFTDISDQPYPNSNIQNTLNGLAFQTAGISTAFLRFYQARNQVWISYPFTYTSALGLSYASVIFIYDVENNMWLPPYVDHKVKKGVNYITSNTQFFITSGTDGNLYLEDSGNTNADSSKLSTSFDAYVTKCVPFGLDSDAFIPRSAFFGLSTGNLSATAYWGANGFNNPAFSNTISIIGSSAEQKKVVPLTTSNKAWNTGQFRFDGQFSNQPFALSPFFFSDQVERQV